MDGYFRFGRVPQHRDLLVGNEECIGGGYCQFDFVSNQIILDRASYDFGRPRWHLIEKLKMPASYRGFRMVYKYNDDFHDDFNVSEELEVEYYDPNMQKEEKAAEKFARKYAKNISGQLTEKDLSYAFSYGLRYGRATLWKKVKPKLKEKFANQQLAIVLKHESGEYQIDIISSADYESYVNNKNCIGEPIKWAPLNQLFSRRINPPTPVDRKKPCDFEDLIEEDMEE